MLAERWESFDVSALYYDLLRGDDDQTDVGHRLVGPGDVVVEIGAGSGRLAVELAPVASAVFALEPNQAMRALMLSHLARHPEALDTVTVLPLAGEDDWVVAGAALPPPGSVDVILLFGVIHMLEPAQRRAVFQNVGRWLADQGRLAITGVTDRAEPVDIPLGSVTVGSLVIEGRLRTRQDPDGWQTSVEYVTWCGNEMVSSESVEYRSHAPVLDTIERELAVVGLHIIWSGALDGQDVVIASRDPSDRGIAALSRTE